MKELCDCLIAEADIPGIADRTKAKLAYNGYVSAADFTGGGIELIWNGYGIEEIAYLTDNEGQQWHIPGLGPRRLTTLLSWREGVMAELGIAERAPLGGHPGGRSVRPQPTADVALVRPGHMPSERKTPAPVAPVLSPRKSRAGAAVLCVCLGFLGIHRFYTGQPGIGCAILLSSLILGPLTLGLWYVVTLAWLLVDLILILVGSVTDEYGRELT